MSPTQRSLAQLRKEGWTAFVVERWNPYGRVRVDLGGFGDVLAWAKGRGCLAVQATTTTNVSSRVNKVAGLETAREWIASPARLEVWGWSKRGPRGERKMWKLKRVCLGLLDGVMVEIDP